MSLEAQGKQTFWHDIPKNCWDIPGAPEKFKKGKSVFNSLPQAIRSYYGLLLLFHLFSWLRAWVLNCHWGQSHYIPGHALSFAWGESFSVIMTGTLQHNILGAIYCCNVLIGAVLGSHEYLGYSYSFSHGAV